MIFSAFAFKLPSSLRCHILCTATSAITFLQRRLSSIALINCNGLNPVRSTTSMYPDCLNISLFVGLLSFSFHLAGNCQFL